MATTVITGRDLTLTIASANYDAQATSVQLANAPVISVYETLDGTQYKHTNDQWTLTVELLADWGAASSLFEAMWAAADTAPNTTLAVSLTAVTGAVFTCNILPVFPSVNGTGPDAQTDTWTMTVVGKPADTFSA